MSYICHHCGVSHEEIPLSFAADFPDQYANMSPGERDNRCVMGSDQCVIDHEAFFIRGLLEIPVGDADQVFLWGLWTRVWEKDYDEFSEIWEEQGREGRHGPFKARLANRLAVYPNTLNLIVTIRVQPVGQRPLFFVDEEDHPLATALRFGMSMEETQELVARLLHPDA
jgi:hypothetical protein